MPAVNPEILTWARETAGLSLEAAAKAINLTDTQRTTGVEKLVALEQGEAEPSRSELLRMSERYRRSLVVFYLDAPPKRGDRGQDFRTLPDSRTTAEDALLDALIRDLQTRQTLVKAVLEDEEAQPLPFVGSVRIEGGVESGAQRIQSTIDFDLKSFRAANTAENTFTYLRNRIESVGIFVLLAGDLGSHHTAIPIETFRGFAIADPIAPFVVINNQDARSARSFTALHETAHVWLGTTGVSGTSADSRIEQFCNDVAGEILLPRYELEELANIQARSPEDAAVEIVTFAHARRISRQMVAYKLYRSQAIGETLWRKLDEQFDQEWREAKKKEQEDTASGGPSYYLTQGNRVGRSLLGLVNRALNEGALTPTKAAKVLGVNPRTVAPLLKASVRQGGS